MLTRSFFFPSIFFLLIPPLFCQCKYSNNGCQAKRVLDQTLSHPIETDITYRGSHTCSEIVKQLALKEDQPPAKKTKTEVIELPIQLEPQMQLSITAGFPEAKTLASQQQKPTKVKFESSSSLVCSAIDNGNEHALLPGLDDCNGQALPLHSKVASSPLVKNG